MTTNKFYLTTLLFLIAMLGYLAYRIMSPFLVAIAWAMVFTIVFYPVFVFISRYVRIRTVSALITIGIILIVLIGPITYIFFLLIDELQSFAGSMDKGNLEPIRKWYEGFQNSSIFQRISTYIGAGNMPSVEVLMNSIKKIGSGLIADISLQITNVLSFLLNFLFMIFTIFFLLKDTPDFLAKAKDYMPFSEKQKERLTNQVKDMIISTVYGGATVALIQGLLGGIAYYIIGLESPVMWGMAMAIMSFVPLLGTFSIWGPTSFYLIFQESYLKGFGLFFYGVLVISMVDNILRPMIIGSRTKMPTILIFFSVLGGIKLFGMIGFIMGPLIMAVFISVFEIFRHIEDEQTRISDTTEKN